MNWMSTFSVDQLVEQAKSTEHTYTDFFRAETLSLGFAFWPAGKPDTQSPHAEDEVYYVVSGKGAFTCEGETVTVQAGSLLFVRAGAVHRFLDIMEDLNVLVFWAPPYGSREPVPGE
jgi:mannose-6-phosphate isomerase-like protein (cupin superfamily)